jgi:hypothetical protein
MEDRSAIAILLFGFCDTLTMEQIVTVSCDRVMMHDA